MTTTEIYLYFIFIYNTGGGGGGGEISLTSFNLILTAEGESYYKDLFFPRQDCRRERERKSPPPQQNERRPIFQRSIQYNTIHTGIFPLFYNTGIFASLSIPPSRFRERPITQTLQWPLGYYPNAPLNLSPKASPDPELDFSLSKTPTTN